MTIAFTIPGVPVAQPRQRHALIAGHIRNYTPTRDPVNVWKAATQHAAAAAYDGPLLDGPLSLDVTCIFPRPASRTWKTKPMLQVPRTGKPDVDNLYKALADALTGVLFKDDAQITDAVIRKREAAGDEQARTEVVVSSMDVNAAVRAMEGK